MERKYLELTTDSELYQLLNEFNDYSSIFFEEAIKFRKDHDIKLNSEPTVELTAKFLLETRGSWNSWFNQAIENHINYLTMISNGDRHIKVIRKGVNIYTVDFEKEEQVELV